MTTLTAYTPPPAIAARGPSTISHTGLCTEWHERAVTEKQHGDFACTRMATGLTHVPSDAHWNWIAAGTQVGIVADEMVSRISLPQVRMAEDYEILPGSARVAALVRAITASLNDMLLTQDEALELARGILASIPNSHEPVHEAPSHVSERVNSIAQAANLTREETAQLLRVSRRALQNWVSGGPISAVRDRHLRETAEFMEEQSQRYKPASLRDKLYARSTPHALRAFDLISEGAFDAARTAIETASGSDSSAPVGMDPYPMLGLDARIIGEDGGASLPAGQPSARFRRRGVRS